MTIQVGERIPDVPITIATADGPEATTSSDYFAGKKVALFAVPGALRRPAPRGTCRALSTRPKN